LVSGSKMGPEGLGLEVGFDEGAEGDDGGVVAVFGPDHDEGDGVMRGEGEEFEAGIEGEDAFGDDADAGAGFGVLEDGADEAGGVGDAGGEAGFLAGGEDGVVGAGAFAAGEEDDGLVGEFLPREGGLLSEGVLGGNDGAEGFLTQGEGFQVECFMGDDGSGEADGEAAAGDHFPDAFGGAFFEDDGDAGEAVAIFEEEGAEEGASGGADVAEAEFAVLAGGGAADAAEGFFESIEEEAGFFEEGGACGGEADAAAVAVHEAAAEFEFKFLNGAAEGGLGDAEFAGGFGEAEFLGDGLEVAEVAEVHGAQGGKGMQSHKGGEGKFDVDWFSI
jgi:hypothetical protein